MGGKPLNKIWKNFERFKKPNKTGWWARCKKCQHEFQSAIDRMERHAEECQAADEVDEENNSDARGAEAGELQSQSMSQGTQPGTSSNTVKGKRKISDPSTPRLKQKQLKIQRRSDADIVLTSPAYKAEMDEQWAKYFFATNSAFNHANHPQFLKACEMMRPGYTPPSSSQISDRLLDTVHTDLLQQCQSTFLGKTVTMALDGSSNIHQDPIVCVTIADSNGNYALVNAVDTSGNQHTAEYLKELASDSIVTCENEFQVRVGSFVTDNTGNVTKMRRILQAEDNTDIIQYGCNAHILNLLSKDVKISSVDSQVVKIIKYFRNKHIPAALYKKAGGKKLVMPVSVRWNTLHDAIESYVKNRGVLVQICEDNKSKIDSTIYGLVNNLNLVAHAKDYNARMHPIAIALDRTQRDKTTIAVAVEVWHKLELDLKDQPQHVKSCFESRKKMALGAPHYLANLIDHRFRGLNLSAEEKNLAFEYLSEINSEFLPVLMCHTSAMLPFQANLYEKSLRNTDPITWWKSVNVSDKSHFDWDLLKEPWLRLCEQLLSTSCTTAGVERVFSSFSLVQSKLRNRLGNEKAGKLTFIFKQLNQTPSDKKKCNIKWVWDEEDLKIPGVDNFDENEAGDTYLSSDNDSDHGEESEDDSRIELVNLAGFESESYDENEND